MKKTKLKYLGVDQDGDPILKSVREVFPDATITEGYAATKKELKKRRKSRGCC